MRTSAMMCQNRNATQLMRTFALQFRCQKLSSRTRDVTIKVITLGASMHSCPTPGVSHCSRTTLWGILPSLSSSDHIVRFPVTIIRRSDNSIIKKNIFFLQRPIAAGPGRAMHNCERTCVPHTSVSLKVMIAVVTKVMTKVMTITMEIYGDAGNDYHTHQYFCPKPTATKL